MYGSHFTFLCKLIYDLDSLPEGVHINIFSCRWYRTTPSPDQCITSTENLFFISLNRSFQVSVDGRHRFLNSTNSNSQTFLQTRWFSFCLFHSLTRTKPWPLFPQTVDSSPSPRIFSPVVPIWSVTSSECQCCDFLRRQDGWFSNIHSTPNGWV